MNKFATKIAALIATASMLVTPVLGVVPADTGDTMYPEDLNLENTVRMYLGGVADLVDASVDLEYRDGVEDLYEVGTVTVYGNDKGDDDGTDYYDSMWFEFGVMGDPDEFGVISLDSSTTTPSYNLYYDNAYQAGNEVWSYNTDEETPGTSAVAIGNLLQEEAINGDDVLLANGWTVEDALSDVLDSTTQPTSLVMKGDPDRLPEYMDEVWVWAMYGDEEYAWHFDIELGVAMQDEETAEVENVNVVTRGTIGRVDIAPGDMDGVVGYLVDITGDSWGDEIATQYTVMFFESVIDEEYDVTVYTLNAEGDKSEDGVEVSENAADRVDMEEVLPDMDADNVFYDQVQYIYKLGIVNGYSNGNYGPEDPVTRAQLAVFVMNTFKLPFNLQGEMFDDVDPSNGFFSYIQSLKNAQVVRGFSDGTFRPGENVTRGQAMAYFYNASNYFDDEAVDGTTSCTFGDYDEFGDFEEAVCSISEYVDSDSFQPIIGGYSNGDFGVSDNLTRGQMAAIALKAGAMIEGDINGNAFIQVPAFAIAPATSDRVFVAPIAVENFEDADADDDSVELTWDALSVDDDSVSGYILERQEEGQSDWDDLDGEDDGDLGTVVGDSSDGYIPRMATFVDNSVDDDTRYEYRIAAVKFIPEDFSVDDYAGQAAMQAATDDRFNMVIGAWSYTSVKTDETP